MSLWVIIPVKPLRRGKSRLMGVLSEQQREVLNYTMLDKTLSLMKDVPIIDQVLVVSRDPAALVLAREKGARTLMEDGSPELNLALTRATAVAKAYSARKLLILPADLPLLTLEDLEAFINSTGNPPEVIIAPDRRWDGTNAMLMNPIGIMDYCFGDGSLMRHVAQAKEKGIHLEVRPLASIGFDLDLPEDLEMLRQIENKEFALINP